MGLPEKIYNQEELEIARTKGQVIGWLQGAAVVIVGGVILNMLGWIPTIAIIGVGGFVAYKLISKPKH